jgi:hypothetical protein
MKTKPTLPNLGERPFGLTVERRMAPPSALYLAWTAQWVRWQKLIV